MDDVSGYIFWGNLAGFPLILDKKEEAIDMAEVVQDFKLYDKLLGNEFLSLLSQFEYVNSFVIPWLKG